MVRYLKPDGLTKEVLAFALLKVPAAPEILAREMP